VGPPLPPAGAAADTLLAPVGPEVEALLPPGPDPGEDPTALAGPLPELMGPETPPARVVPVLFPAA